MSLGRSGIGARAFACGWALLAWVSPLEAARRAERSGGFVVLLWLGGMLALAPLFLSALVAHPRRKRFLLAAVGCYSLVPLALWLLRVFAPASELDANPFQPYGVAMLIGGLLGPWVLLGVFARARPPED